MLRVLIRTCVCVCFLAGAAFAQDGVGVPINPKRALTPEEAARKKASDEAYQAAINKIPDKKSPADPWGTIRPASPASKNKPQQ
jgi:hypothetical protein